jgi:hypothetical protein
MDIPAFLNQRSRAIQVLFGNESGPSQGGGAKDVNFSRYLRAAKPGQRGSCSQPLPGIPLAAPLLEPIVEGNAVLSHMPKNIRLVYTYSDAVRKEVQYTFKTADVTREALALYVAESYVKQFDGIGNVGDVRLVKLEWERENVWNVIVA